MHLFVVLDRLIKYMIGLKIAFLIRKKNLSTVKHFDRSKKCDVTEINLNLRCTNHSQNVSVVLLYFCIKCVSIKKDVLRVHQMYLNAPPGCS